MTPEPVTDLYTIVSVGIAQQLLQTSTVQKFFDENLACAMLRNANALRERLIEIRQYSVICTFSITLELNFCTESAQTFPVN